MRGVGEEKRLVRIFFSDGINREFARKKDGILVELNEGYIRFIDIRDGNEQVIPMSKIFRVVFIGKEGNNEDRMD